MPMPRVIGISLACLVTSACAPAKMAEGNTSRYSAASAGMISSNAKLPNRGSLGSPCGKTDDSAPADTGVDRRARCRMSLPVAADGCRDAAGPCCSRLPEAADSQFGKAAWYDLVGRETASGEILDTVTATAANLSLPLGSFAKVTDLDNGRSVIVKINDRGPYTRGRIIDLSPRAAEALQMKVAGVAAVVIEPLENQVDPVADVLPAQGSEAAP